MSDAQMHVLGILGATVALEALRSQNVRNFLAHPIQATGQDAAAALAFGSAAFVLVVLAAAAPTLATGIAILIFLLALVNNAGLIAGILQGSANLLSHL
jgi:hypothetical protein